MSHCYTEAKQQFASHRFSGGVGVDRSCGVGFFCGASSLFFLSTLFGFGELFLQAFHFFLALLERDTLNASSQVR